MTQGYFLAQDTSDSDASAEDLMGLPRRKLDGRPWSFSFPACR